MNTKSLIYLETVVEDRTYRLEMPIGANLGEAYKVTSEFLDEIIRYINENAKARQEAEKPEDEEECQEESSE